MEKIKPNYLVQQPKKLETLAIFKLGDWIALQAEKLMSPELHSNRLVQVMRLFIRSPNPSKAEDSMSHLIEIIRKSLESNMPKASHDKLAIVVMRKLSLSLQNTKPAFWSTDSSQRHVIWRMTETLFTKNLTFLMINLEMLRTSLCSKINMLKSLTRLDLFPSQRLKLCNTIDENNIIQMLKVLPNLKYLTVQEICTDTMLKCVLENCELIEMLNLMFSSRINDKSMDILTGLHNLKNVDLSSTEVSQKGIATLLLSCDNIEEIGIHPDVVACALEHIVSIEENAEKRFKLKSFENYLKSITLKQLQLVVQMCPEIQKMTLVKDPDQISESYVMALSNLQDLRDLELQDYDYSTDQIDKVLDIKGHNLEHLHLVKVEQIDFDVLMSITQKCPNLECLALSQCTFMKQSSVMHNSCSKKLIKHIPSLTNLKRFTLHGACDSELMPTKDYLLFLLSNCPNVEYIDTTLSLTDDIMLEVLSKNPLIYLKELKMWSGKLTKLVIDRITVNCISPPEVMNYPISFEDFLAR